MTLSDVARQAPAEGPKPVSATPALAEVPPITAVETSDKAADAARAGMASALQPRRALNIALYRLSTVGEDVSAVLWVKGRNRKVLPGARVLQYTVGEIRDDGVCLYKTRANGKVKDRCQQFVTFVQGV